MSDLTIILIAMVGFGAGFIGGCAIALMKVNEAGRGVMTSVAEVDQRLSGMAE